MLKACSIGEESPPTASIAIWICRLDAIRSTSVEQNGFRPSRWAALVRDENANAGTKKGRRNSASHLMCLGLGYTVKTDLRLTTMPITCSKP